MAQLSISICRQLARARRAKGMTQHALAQAVACQQSAISMLESGQPGKLSLQTVTRIAALLEVPLPSESADPVRAHRVPAASAYCPNPLCPSNIPYTVNDELLFWPRSQPGNTGMYCAACGEVLEQNCPHCATGVTPGACCPICGKPRVVLHALTEETNLNAWVAQRRRELAEWYTLNQ